MSARRLVPSLLPPLVAFACVLGAWEGYVAVFDVRRIILPAPSAILRAVADSPGRWWSDALVTGREALVGFLLALVVALVIAVAVTHSRLLERALLPVIAMVQVIPIIALAPPLVIWLGFGLAPKVVMAALITFVPLTVNAIAGLQAVDRDTLEVFRSVDASRREVFLKLRLPHALPYLLAATRVCVGLALIGAVVAEWSASSSGLGYTFSRARNAFAADQMWAAVFVLTTMGIAGTTLVGAVERRLLRWRASRLRQ